MNRSMQVIAMNRGSIWPVLGAEEALSRRVQEREPGEHEKSWDGLMAEAVAFLISARTSLQNLSSESACDPHAERILASVSGKVVRALSALDYLSVTQWIRSGSTVIRAETIPIMRCEENHMTGCRVESCWAAGGSRDRAGQITHQHTPSGELRSLPIVTDQRSYDSE
jgi:hypothetical protein